MRRKGKKRWRKHNFVSIFSQHNNYITLGYTRIFFGSCLLFFFFNWIRTVLYLWIQKWPPSGWANPMWYLDAAHQNDPKTFEKPQAIFTWLLTGVTREFWQRCIPAGNIKNGISLMILSTNKRHAECDLWPVLECHIYMRASRNKKCKKKKRATNTAVWPQMFTAAALTDWLTGMSGHIVPVSQLPAVWVFSNLPRLSAFLLSFPTREEVQQVIVEVDSHFALRMQLNLKTDTLFFFFNLSLSLMLFFFFFPSAVFCHALFAAAFLKPNMSACIHLRADAFDEFIDSATQTSFGSSAQINFKYVQ